jgi:hypothetical protein
VPSTPIFSFVANGSEQHGQASCRAAKTRIGEPRTAAEPMLPKPAEKLNQLPAERIQIVTKKVLDSAVSGWNFI